MDNTCVKSYNTLVPAFDGTFRVTEQSLSLYCFICLQRIAKPRRYFYRPDPARRPRLLTESVATSTQRLKMACFLKSRRHLTGYNIRRQVCERLSPQSGPSRYGSGSKEFNSECRNDRRRHFARIAPLILGQSSVNDGPIPYEYTNSSFKNILHLFLVGVEFHLIDYITPGVYFVCPSK